MKKPQRDFDKEAATWDENPARVKLARDLAAAITAEVRLSREMDALDFGCGTGLLTMLVAPFVKSITGADSSAGMLDVLTTKAQRQGQPNVRTLHVPPTACVPGSYDLILSSMAFHHVEDTQALLSRLFRALNTPGTLCVADLDPDQGEFHPDPAGVYHFGFDRRVLEEQFRKAGFSRVRHVTATHMTRPTRTGQPREFGIFLMIGERQADAVQASRRGVAPLEGGVT